MTKINNLDFLEIMNNLYDGIYIADSTGTTIFVNDSYCKMTGISKNEIIGKKVIELEGRLYKGSVTAEVLKQKKIVSSIGKSLITQKNLLITGSPIFDEKGNIKLVVVIDRDISDLKKLEEDNKILKEINEKNENQIFYLNENQILNKDMELSELPSNIYNIFKDVAHSNLTVFIVGEYGSGKENLAQKIYQYSSRNESPFFSIDARSYTDGEFEKRLFGTDVETDREAFSLLELANNGTLYIANVDSLSQKLQKKILKILNSKKFKNLNSENMDLDIRFIFSTSIDLKKEVEKERFLAELYNKINLITLKLPPLRERKKDIVKLAEKFISNFNKKYSKNIVLNQEDFKLFKLYDWPGNIKELESFIERLIVFNNENTDIQETIKSMLLLKHSDIFSQQNLSLKEALKEIEKNIIIKVLNQYGSINKTASVLGISQPALSKKCRQLNILK